MTYDTFQSLTKGSRLKRTGLVRSYPVVRIGKQYDRRVVYVCLNPLAVEKRKDAPLEFGIFASKDLNDSTHYLNWEKIS